MTGNSECSTWTIQTHPLLISVVLSEVFSNVDEFEDLKNIRLVCKLWAETSLGGWRKSVVLRLSGMKGSSNKYCDGCPPKAIQTASGRGTLDIETFLQFVQKSTEQGYSGPMQLSRIPFRNYRIQQYSLLDFDIGGGYNFQQLIRACGAHMKYLELDHFALYSDHYPELFNLLKDLTNLKELTVILAPFERWGRQAQGHDAIVEAETLTDSRGPFPKHAWSLETVSMGQCGKTWKVGMPRRKEWRKFFRYTPNLKNLTVDEGALTLIRELKVPSITGHPIRLSSLTFLYKKRDSSAEDFHGWGREYMEAVGVELQSKIVDLTQPETVGNRRTRTPIVSTGFKLLGEVVAGVVCSMSVLIIIYFTIYSLI